MTKGPRTKEQVAKIEFRVTWACLMIVVIIGSLLMMSVGISGAWPLSLTGEEPSLACF